MKTGSPDLYSLSESDRWVVLARYLAGESNAAEAEAVHHWVADQPARGKLLAALEQVSHPAGQASAAPVDVERGLARVKARFPDAEARSLFGRRGFGERPAPEWRTIAFRLAAAVALVASAVLLWRAARSGHPAASPRLAERSWATGIGRTDSIPLPDSSVVVLGPGSRLLMAAGYGDSARTLTLSLDDLQKLIGCCQPETQALHLGVWITFGHPEQRSSQRHVVSRDISRAPS